MFVLAGGFGTRLRSIVSDVPKPLAPVMGEAFITYLIEHWVEQGVKDFVFLLHYEAKKIENVLQRMSSIPKFSSVSFKSIVEDVPLGTGGSVLNAIATLDCSENFLVANADTWLGSGVEIVSKERPCTLIAVKVPDCKRYGALTIDNTVVKAFREKSSSIGQGYVNSGLYHLTPAAFDGHVSGSAFSLEKDVFPRLVASGKLRAIQMEVDFIDIGVPDDYLRFCNWIKLGKNIEL